MRIMLAKCDMNTTKELSTSWSPAIRTIPAFPALIVGGSIAKDDATAASDVDVMFIASDEEYQRRHLARRASICLIRRLRLLGRLCRCQVFHSISSMKQPCAVVSRHAVRSPGRSSLTRGYPSWRTSCGASLCTPRQNNSINSSPFYSQFTLNAGYFWKQAEKREDPYLKARVAAEMVLFGGRLILAHNKILFPSQKWLMQYVERAPEKPEGFALLAQRLLQIPSRETVEQFTACIEGFRDWGVTTNVLMRFIEDTEWSWYTRTPAVAEW